MSKIIGKVIHFPSAYNSKRCGYPEVVYVAKYFSNSIQGSRYPEEVEDGRSRSFLMNRCMPYSEETWHLCKRHIAKRAEIEKEYKQLENLARKKDCVQTISPAAADVLVLVKG